MNVLSFFPSNLVNVSENVCSQKSLSLKLPKEYLKRAKSMKNIVSANIEELQLINEMSTHINKYFSLMRLQLYLKYCFNC